MATYNLLCSAMVIGLALLSPYGDAYSNTASDFPPINLQVILDEAIQDEYKAEQTYTKVIAIFGNIHPFVHIIEAEKRHIAALTRLYDSYDLEKPASNWNQDHIPHFQTVPQACSYAVKGEKENIAMYQRFFSQDLPDDVRFVMRRLHDASREAHLPAFERCAQK